MVEVHLSDEEFRAMFMTSEGWDKRMMQRYVEEGKGPQAGTSCPVCHQPEGPAHLCNGVWIIGPSPEDTITVLGLPERLKTHYRREKKLEVG